MDAIFTVLAELLLNELAKRPQFDSIKEKIAGQSAEKRALENALRKTYSSFDDKFPSITASFFDSAFLQKESVRKELEKLLTPNLYPSASEIEKAWLSQFRNTEIPSIRDEIEFFLQEFLENIQAEPALKQFVNSRYLFGIDKTLKNIEQHMSVLTDDQRLYSRSMVNEQVSLPSLDALPQLIDNSSTSKNYSQSVSIQPHLDIGCFVGYRDIRQQILNSDIDHNFAVLGITGSGKSYLLTKLASDSPVPTFQYEFRQNLISIKDLLFRLGLFFKDIFGEVIEVQQLLASDQIPDMVKFDLVTELLNRKPCMLLFDSVQYVSVDNHQVTAFSQKLLEKSNEYKVVFASQIEPNFLRERDYAQNKVKRLTLRGLKDNEVKDYLKCKKISLTEEQVNVISTIDGLMPIVLDFLIPLLTDDDTPLSDIQSALNYSEEKVAEELFEQIYSKLTLDEQTVLSILALFVLPTDRDLFNECATQILPNPQLRIALSSLKRKILFMEYEHQYLHLHEIIRQLTSSYSNVIEDHRLTIAGYLYQKGLDTFEGAFEVFQMYFIAKQFDEAANLLTDYTRNFIPFHVDTAQLFLSAFSRDMVKVSTWMWLMGSKGDLLLHLKRYSEAEIQYREMIEIAESEGDDLALSQAFLSLGNVYYHQNKQEALKFYNRCLELKENLHDEYGQSRVMNNIALIYIDLGQYELATETLTKCQNILKSLDVPEWRMMNVLGNLGNLHFKQTDYDTADNYANEVLMLARKIEDPLQEARSLHNLGLHQAKRGNKDAARSYFMQAVEIGKEFNSWEIIELASDGLVDHDLGQQNYGAVKEELLNLLKSYEEIENLLGITTTKFKLGAIYLALKEYGSAIDYFTEALEYVELAPDRFVDTQIGNLVQFSSISDHTSNIVDLFKTAKSRLCELEPTFALARIYGALGEIYANALSNPRIAELCLKKEVEILVLLNFSSFQVERLIDLGNFIASENNKLKESVTLLTKALDSSTNTTDKLRAIYHRGIIYAIGGAWAKAKNDFEEIVTYANHEDYFLDEQIEADTRRNLGEVYRQLGQLEDAKDMLESSITILQSLGLIEAEILANCSIASILKATGDRGSALTKFMNVLEICSNNQFERQKIVVHIDIGNIFFEEDDLQEATVHYEQALKLAKAIEDIHLEEGSIISLAYVYHKQGKIDEIEQDFQEALNRAGELENYDNLIQMLTLAGRINLGQEDNPVIDAVDVFEQAFKVSLYLSYSKIDTGTFLDEAGLVIPVFEIMEEVCEAIGEQIEQGNKARAKEFYNLLISKVEQIEVDVDWIIERLSPIQTYFKMNLEEYLWKYVVESWDSLNQDDN